jgi:hypothetical protein
MRLIRLGVRHRPGGPREPRNGRRNYLSREGNTSGHTFVGARLLGRFVGKRNVRVAVGSILWGSELFAQRADLIEKQRNVLSRGSNEILICDSGSAEIDILTVGPDEIRSGDVVTTFHE